MMWKKKKAQSKIVFVGNQKQGDWLTDLKNQQSKKQPKTAQETIPFDEIYENGVFRTGTTFSLPYSIQNIDYTMMRDNYKKALYEKYQAYLNSMPTDICYQEFLMNTPYDFKKLRDAVIPSDELSHSKFKNIYQSYCNIIEKMIDKSSQTANEMIFIGVISYTPQNKLDDISILFRYFSEINDHLLSLGSRAEILKPMETFGIMHTFYHPLGDEPFLIPSNYYRHDVNLKDYIAPAGFSFKSRDNRNGKQVIMGGSTYTRVLFAKRFSRNIDDKFIYDLVDNNHKIIVTKHIRRLDKETAMAMLKTYMDDLEGKIEKRRENNGKRNTTYVPWKLREQEEEAEALQRTLSSSDCNLHEFSLFVRLSAGSLEDLDDLTAYIKSKAIRHNVVLDVLGHQQEKGLNSCLPLAINYLTDNENCCTHLLTPEVGILIPFSYNNYFSPAGLSYGINMLTNSPMVIDRCDELNANMFVLGTSGSGKSMFVKRELISAIQKYTDDEILVIDPENEYLPLLEDLDGERIILSPSSQTHINIFDTDISFTEDGSDFRALKSEFIMNFCEMAKGMKLDSKEISVIDRCVKLCYTPFLEHNGDKDYLPTLTDFYNYLKSQPEEEAKDVALNIELYVTGSFNNFAHKTNVKYNDKKFIIYDIYQMGEQLRTVGLQVLLEMIWQRVKINKSKGVRTWLWCDEFSIMFADGSGKETVKSGEFFQKVYSRIRKYGGVATGVTQNITTVLQSSQATSMLNNAACVVLLQQNPSDLNKIVELFNLSKEQAKYINKGKDGAGQGLFILGTTVVPFDNRFDTNSYMYKKCSTKFSEKQRNTI